MAEIKTKRRCKRCNELKLITEYPEKGIRSGVQQYGTICKQCLSHAAEDTEKPYGTTLDEYLNIDLDEMIKLAGKRQCRICHVWKPINQFNKDRISNGEQKYRSECKACHRKMNAERTKLYKDRKQLQRVDITEAQWKDIEKDFENSCAYCGKPWDEKDHIVPVSLGGATTAANLIPACKSCNAKKGNRDLLTWYTQSTVYEPARLVKIINHIKKYKKTGDDKNEQR